MVYSDNVTFCRYTGLGLRVRDENIGTGDSSESSYDLDNDNVIADSYTLSYAASGSNDFTDLTETDDYALDKESGRIVLTSDGVTTLGSNVLYATYMYSGNDNINDGDIDDFLEKANLEVDRSTGQFWGTSTEVIEYHDGVVDKVGHGNYPITDQPYMKDYDRDEYIQLEQKPVLQVESVYFLARGASLSKVFSYDDSETTYTDNTAKAVDPTENNFYVFAETPLADDIIYFGSPYKFLGLNIRLGVAGVSSDIAIDWEYYDGVAEAWTDITETEIDENSSLFTATGRFTFTEPNNWGKVTINSSEQYYIRAKLSSGTYTTSPQIKEVAMDQDLVISEEIALSGIDVSSTGKLSFIKKSIPNGTRNIRIVYKKGVSTTPEAIKQLESLYGGIMAYAAITGGSYDALTSYTIGNKAVTVGEQYVNVAEVVKQFRVRIDEILRIYGRRGIVI